MRYPYLQNRSGLKVKINICRNITECKNRFCVRILQFGEYQIYEAKVIGASAVLLICALLDTETIRKRIEICDSLGLSALVEAHTEEEVKSALDAGARIIGVNNRNLKDFTVDLTTCTRLRNLYQREIYLSAKANKNSRRCAGAGELRGVNGLLGETLMRNADKRKRLKNLTVISYKYKVLEKEINQCRRVSLVFTVHICSPKL